MKKKRLYAGNMLLLIALFFFTFLMIRLSYRYLPMRSDIDFLQTKQNIYHINYWRWSFYTHVFTSSIVLLAGLTQFSGYIKTNIPRIHRVVGYSYVLIVIFITGPAAFVMGLYANGGLPARISFTMLSSLWILFTALAWYHAVNKNFKRHSVFMQMSYALTLSAITLRLYTFVFAYFHLHMKPVDLYILTAWLSWVPNLCFAILLSSWRSGVVRETSIS